MIEAAVLRGAEASRRHVALVVVQVDPVMLGQGVDKADRVIGDPRPLGRPGGNDGDPRAVRSRSTGSVHPTDGLFEGVKGAIRGILPAEGRGAVEGSTAEVACQVRVGEDAAELRGDVGRVVGVGQQAGVADHLDLRRVVARHHRSAAKHRLQQGEAQALVTRGERERGATSVKHPKRLVANFAGQNQGIGDPEGGGEIAVRHLVLIAEEAGHHDLMIASQIGRQGGEGGEQTAEVLALVDPRDAVHEGAVDPQAVQNSPGRSRGGKGAVWGKEGRISGAADGHDPVGPEVEHPQAVGPRGVRVRHQEVVMPQGFQTPVVPGGVEGLGQISFLEMNGIRSCIRAASGRPPG